MLGVLLGRTVRSAIRATNWSAANRGALVRSQFPAPPVTTVLARRDNPADGSPLGRVVQWAGSLGRLTQSAQSAQSAGSVRNCHDVVTTRVNRARTDWDNEGHHSWSAGVIETTRGTVEPRGGDCKSVGLRPGRRIVHVQGVPDSPTVGERGGDEHGPGCKSLSKLAPSGPWLGGSATQARGP
jgi:hypothetical protein